MKLLKDLLYTKGNENLDIARVSAMLSILAFWGAVLWRVIANGIFEPVETGTGCAAIMAGSAGWIHFRQKHEGEALDNTDHQPKAQGARGEPPTQTGSGIKP